jgi:site-specific recombinase XerC
MVSFQASQALTEVVSQYFVRLNTKGLSSNSLRCYHSDIKSFLDFMGDYRLISWQQLTKKQVFAFLHNAQRQDKAETSLKRLLGSVRGFLHYLIEQKLLTEDILLEFEFTFSVSKKSSIDSVIDIPKLLEFSHNDFLAIRDKALLTLVLETDLKLSEIAALDFYAIDFSNKNIVTKPKRMTEQTIKLSDELISTFNIWFEKRQSVPAINDKLFVAMTGRALSERAIQLRIERRGDVFGISKLTSSRLRKQLANQNGFNPASYNAPQQQTEQFTDLYLKAHPRAK